MKVAKVLKHECTKHDLENPSNRMFLLSYKDYPIECATWVSEGEAIDAASKAIRAYNRRVTLEEKKVVAAAKKATVAAAQKEATAEIRSKKQQHKETKMLLLLLMYWTKSRNMKEYKQHQKLWMLTVSVVQRVANYEHCIFQRRFKK